MTLRCALYARYSSDRQNALSVEDQLAAGNRRAQERGWTVVATFSDSAISGEALQNRPGIQGALACATSGVFDVLMAEDEDRFARNMEHMAHVYNRITDLGLTLATFITWPVELMHVAFKGYQAQAWVDGHRLKTQRGMRANAEKGLATGSRLYGYRSQPGGGLEIVETEANVVREIFDLYVAGRTGRQIAAELNRRGTKGPHGGQWNASSILGSPTRGNGVLRTELYAGVKVWNRFDMKKDRQTGKRISRAIPKADWKRTPAPAARILEQAVWDDAQARLTDRAVTRERRPQALRRYPGVFSGLLKCGCCDAGYTIVSRDVLGCAGRRERGAAACTNAFQVRRPAVEARILAGLQTQLLHPDAVKAYVDEYRRAAADHRRARVADRLPLERRLAVLERQAERLVDAIADGVAPVDVKERFHALDAERVTLRAQLDRIARDEGSQTVVLHPNAAAVYRAKVAVLQQLLAAAAAGPARPDQDLCDAVRELVTRIEIHPDPAAAQGFTAIAYGTIAPLLRAGEFLYTQASDALVAGGRIELPT